MDEMLQALIEQAKKAGQFATTPLTDKPAQMGAQAAESITTPKLGESPLTAKAKGFAGGAVQGLGNLISGQTSPIALLSMLAGGGLGMAGRGAAEGMAAGGDAVQSALSTTKITAPELGKIMSEFTPVTQEAEQAYNAGRPAMAAAKDPSMLGYQKIMGRMGMGDQSGKITPEAAILSAGTAGGLGYAGLKALKALKGTGGAVNSAVNPIKKLSDLLDEQQGK